MERLDVWLVKMGYFPSREKARLAVMAGEVEIVGRGRAQKAGTMVGPGDRIVVRTRSRFVSRGGEKLDGALDRLGLPVEGRLALDVGASTGGFTQCLLERGASAVIALDVGKGQLHWKLRRDPRVCVMEGYNARYLRREDLPFLPGLVVADLSFISLRKVLSALASILDEGGDLVALIKPQFEAGKGLVGKGGVVRDPDIHRRVLKEVLEEAESHGFRLRGLVPSPVRGADGNLEYFAWWKLGGGRTGEVEPSLSREVMVEEAVKEGWSRPDSGG